jgi:hypothetical protein
VRVPAKRKHPLVGPNSEGVYGAHSCTRLSATGGVSPAAARSRSVCRPAAIHLLGSASLAPGHGALNTVGRAEQAAGAAGRQQQAAAGDIVWYGHDYYPEFGRWHVFHRLPISEVTS